MQQIPIQKESGDFYNSLSKTELQAEWDEYWKIQRKKWGEANLTPFLLIGWLLEKTFYLID